MGQRDWTLTLKTANQGQREQWLAKAPSQAVPAQEQKSVS